MNAENLRELALSLPHATEDVKWGNDLCFCIAEKMFCVTGLSGEFGASFKVRNDEFDDFCSRKHIEPAKYVGRYKWVYVSRPDALSDKEWEHGVSQSYHLVKSKLSKKKQNELT